jgi:hypothetical protein
LLSVGVKDNPKAMSPLTGLARRMQV